MGTMIPGASISEWRTRLCVSGTCPPGLLTGFVLARTERSSGYESVRFSVSSLDVGTVLDKLDEYKACFFLPRATLQYDLAMVWPSDTMRTKNAQGRYQAKRCPSPSGHERFLITILIVDDPQTSMQPKGSNSLHEAETLGHTREGQG